MADDALIIDLSGSPPQPPLPAPTTGRAFLPRERGVSRGSSHSTIGSRRTLRLLERHDSSTRSLRRRREDSGPPVASSSQLPANEAITITEGARTPKRRRLGVQPSVQWSAAPTTEPDLSASEEEDEPRDDVDDADAMTDEGEDFDPLQLLTESRSFTATSPPRPRDSFEDIERAPSLPAMTVSPERQSDPRPLQYTREPSAIEVEALPLTATSAAGPVSADHSMPSVRAPSLARTGSRKGGSPLAHYACPICFCPPVNATLTPCGHTCCGECLFTAVKTAQRRAAYSPEPEALHPRCPVCRADLPGWDGKGGGVIGLQLRVVTSV